MTTPPLIIIPARAGSTRIPDKNFRSLAGRSPVSRAIDVTACLPGVQIVVTTDAPQQVWVWDFWGTVYTRRTSGDGSMRDVVLEVLEAYPGSTDQAVLLVQPTQPLREVKHLRQALKMLTEGGCSSVASVVQTISADKLYRLIEGQRLWAIGAGCERDQDGAPTYRCDGTVYGFRRQWFLEASPARAFRHPIDTMPLIIPPDETCALDTPHDWYLASLILNDRRRGEI